MLIPCVKFTIYKVKMECQAPVTNSKSHLAVVGRTFGVMLSKINASTKLDKRKSLLLLVGHCVRVPIGFGDAVNLMEAVVEEFHVININKKRDNSTHSNIN